MFVDDDLTEFLEVPGLELGALITCEYNKFVGSDFHSIGGMVNFNIYLNYIQKR